MSLSTLSLSKTTSIPVQLRATILTGILGLVIIYGVGFAQGKANVVHNAAHDTRHAMAFPCH